MRNRNTRRGFIATALAAIASTLTKAVVKAESQPEITQEQALKALGYEPVFPDGVPEPYPNPVRNNIINRWIKDVDDTLVHLERFHSYLIDASRQSPEDTDGAEGYKLMYAAFDAMKDLCHGIECGSDRLHPDGVLMALSGEPMPYICYREGLLYGDIHEPEKIQREIADLSEDYPEYGAELQRLFDARFSEAVDND